MLKITIEGLEYSMKSSSKNHLLKGDHLIIKYTEQQGQLKRSTKA